jgi:DNA-binding IclR family transcriptional regulator
VEALAHPAPGHHALTGMRPPATRTMSGKLLAVLAAFDAGHRELGLAELSARTGLPRTTTYRLVAELVAWGALERGAGGRFTVGLRLLEVASLAPRGLALSQAARPFLDDLYGVTRQVVLLGVLEGDQVVYVDRVAAPGALATRARLGGRFGWHATGVGRVLMAHAPADVQEAALAGPLERYTPRTEVRPGQLRRVLADVRARGVAVCADGVTLGSAAVAAPVTDSSGGVVAAVSVVLAADGGRPGPLVAAVRTAAAGISRTLAAG